MRLVVQVEQMPDPYRCHGVGDSARRVLGLVKRISDVRIERQNLDSAVLSFEDHDRLDSFGEIDAVLEARGLRRL